ncbi:MAG: C25 family cysteine peptidase [Calditrichaceae bacterium]
MLLNIEKIVFTCFIIILLRDINSSFAEDLKSSENQADYLIISTQHFLDNLDPLISLRESQGLTIKSVNVDTLYGQFQDTLSKQDAIKSFVSYTLEYWSDPKPQYLLLVGDVEFVPSYKVQSRLHDTIYDEDSVSIDDQYAINLYDNDQYPDIAVGRLPVSNNMHLENIIEKIILIEDNLKRKNYTMDYLGLADFREHEYFFENVQDRFTTNILPDYYSYQRIDRREESEYYGMKSDILNILNQGCLFLYYTGHGSPFSWADTSFFQVNDVKSLASNGLPIIFTTAACSQRFDIPDSTTIIEALIQKNKGGTVLSFAPAGLAYSDQGSRIMESLYNKIFEHPEYSLGYIIRLVKGGQAISMDLDDITLRYTLLGDPALKFPSDIVAGIPEPGYESLSKFELYQNYPNPFNSTTVIKLNLLKAGSVTIIAYDINGKKVDTIHDGYLYTGLHAIQWRPNELASGIYLIRMTADNLNRTIRALYIK